MFRLCVLSAVFSRHIQPHYTRSRELVETMVQHLAESIQGVQVTKGFGREAEVRAAFDAKNADVLTQQQGIFWRLSLFTPLVGILTRVNMIVLLGYGGGLVIEGHLPLGAGLVVFYGLLEQFSGQVNPVATLVNSVQQSLIGARRVFEILDAPVEVRDAPDAAHRPRIEGAVRFENVSFAYDGADAVLDAVTLDVKPGQCVAILGATGAGKSALMSLPQGYETILGESGNSLSGGQRQRLAIARAVLLEPSILLLDDPTAAIDSETEHEIFEALDNAIAGRTTFIVAHRMSTLRRADFIVVMGDGRIIQRGTHDELMKVAGSYRRVATLQLLDGKELSDAGFVREGPYEYSAH